MFPDVTVYATARNVAAAKDLKALADKHAGRVEIVQLDMLSASSINVSWYTSCVRVAD